MAQDLSATPTFTSVRKEDNQVMFTLAPIHVSYANTLRRIILTGVESVAFRSDMISTGAKAGTTTDVTIVHNDTPMTNEMLADRVGLLPITLPKHISVPTKWDKDAYEFRLHVTGSKSDTTYVHASDFRVYDPATLEEESESKEDAPKGQPSDEMFPPHPITKMTPLIAVLQPSDPEQQIHIIARASMGTGREHARFSTVSQCSYEYTLDEDPQRRSDMFDNWLAVSKKISSVDKASEQYAALQREFQTMQIKRCYLINEKQEPFSYDFTVESAGPLPVAYIINRACEVAENMCMKYVTLHTDNKLPSEITISPSESRIIGFDFLFRGHDHTLGNLLQTWLVEHHIEGSDEPRIAYAGYSVPHPLRDEVVLRIGLLQQDVDINTAKRAVAQAALGCKNMFQQLRIEWGNASRVLNDGFVRPRPILRRANAASAASTVDSVPVRINKVGQ